MATREQQLQYLEAMGIQAWTARHADDAAAQDAVAPDPAPAETAVSDTPAPVVTAPAPAVSDTSTPVVPVPAVPDTSAPVVPIPAVPDTTEVAALDWPTLEARVSECRLCDLHTSRTRTVFGVGNHNADWLVIGEAPGHDEDQQGEPFVGRAGQLLDAMLKAVGLQRGQVYIANILKCRPPNNRDPRPEEVQCCEPYLLRQIELLQPGLILAVGRIAAQNLLQSQTPIGKLRGEVHQFRDTGIPLIATYHPAYLLRSPTEKRKAWQDLQLAVRTLKEGQR